MSKINNNESTTIKVLHAEYINVQSQLGALIDEHGVVQGGMRYRYLDLQRKAEAFKEAIMILKEMQGRSIAEIVAGPRDESKDSIGIVS